MLSEIHELRQARLEDDLTYQELGEKLGLAKSKVHDLLNASRPAANDRTLFKVRQFLIQRRNRLQKKAMSA